MVPIHDSDLTEQRGSKAFDAEWAQYELWEKIEVRLRRRKILWILGAVLIFFMISSIPVFLDHWPKWTALRLNRLLADQINSIKRESSIEHRAYRIRFESGTQYVVEQAQSCQDKDFTRIRDGSLGGLASSSGDFSVVTPDEARNLGIPGMISDFCYDHLSGSEPSVKGEGLVGFGVIPVKDLTEHRIDRLSVLLLKGPSAEISFE